MEIWIALGVVAFVLLALVLVFITKYRTVGPDEALIVTGSYLGSKNVHKDDSGNRIKIIRGGGTFLLPVFQQAAPLSLLSSKLEVTTPEVYTEQGVPVMADGTAIIKIGGSIIEIATAAEQFLGKSKADRENEAKEVLEGHLRSILGSMTVEEIYKNRDMFSQEVQRVASQDLSKMGLIIVSFTIKDVRDKNGYLDSLGKPRIAQVKRDADIATVEAEKETRIKNAEASKEAQKAEIERATEIAEAEKENQLKVADYRREQDVRKQMPTKHTNLQTAVPNKKLWNKKCKFKSLNVKSKLNLNKKRFYVVRSNMILKLRKKRTLIVMQLNKMQKLQKSKQMAEADAEKYRIEARATADAEKVRLDGQAKADSQRAQGESEADIIRLKGLAEAEAKRKIAEAFEQYGQAAMLDMIVTMIPEYAKQIASPLSNIDKITVVDTGSGEGGGANKVTSYATDLMSTLQETLKATSGIDVKEMLENYAGKHNIRPSIDQLTNEIKAANTKQPAQQRIAEKQVAADDETK